MLGKLILLFTVIPLIELFLLIEIGKRIGSLSTVFLVIFTGIVGAILAKAEGFIVVNKIRMQLEKGEMPGNEIISGLCVLVGGALLVTPGLLSDVVGFLLLIPRTQNIFKGFIKERLRRMASNGTINVWKK